MEASALQAPAGLAGSRASAALRLPRLRSDEQLVALFRAGHEEAFGVIHDRYRQRLFVYMRQMLAGSRQDAEDALQDVFVRAYSGLLASDRQLALRAWLYRIAHNRCIDQLRRPTPPPPELLALVRAPVQDPMAEAERRESLRRLLTDIRRLPTAQRSALLMRELGGMSYVDLADALEVSVPAVKSLLVRARVSLVQALQARDTACSDIREELISAHDRGVRASGMARRHMRDCESCRQFRGEIRGMSRQFAALLPVAGPIGILAHLLGFGGGGAGLGSGGAGLGTGGAGLGSGGAGLGTCGAGLGTGGAVGASGAVGTGGAAASIGALGGSHVAALLTAAVVTAGGAVEIQHTIRASPSAAPHRAHVHRVRALAPASGHAAGSAAIGAYVPSAVSRSAAANPAGPSSPSTATAQAVGGPSAQPTVTPPPPAVTPTTPTSTTTPTTAATTGAPSVPPTGSATPAPPTGEPSPPPSGATGSSGGDPGGAVPPLDNPGTEQTTPPAAPPPPTTATGSTSPTGTAGTP